VRIADATARRRPSRLHGHDCKSEEAQEKIEITTGEQHKIDYHQPVVLIGWRVLSEDNYKDNHEDKMNDDDASEHGSDSSNGDLSGEISRMTGCSLPPVYHTLYVIPDLCSRFLSDWVDLTQHSGNNKSGRIALLKHCLLKADS